MAEKPTAIILAAIAGLVILEIVALLKGINGTLFTMVIAVIAGIGGWAIPSPKELTK